MKNARSTSSSAATTASKPAKTLPAHTIRLGRIKATIWANPTTDGTFYNTTVTRTYMDEQKNFHDTDSFGRDDLPLVVKVADKAHTWIFEKLAADKAADSQEQN